MRVEGYPEDSPDGEAVSPSSTICTAFKTSNWTFFGGLKYMFIKARKVRIMCSENKKVVQKILWKNAQKFIKKLFKKVLEKY